MATQAAGADVLQGGSSRQRLAPLPAESQRPKQLLTSTVDLVERYIWFTGRFKYGWDRTNKNWGGRKYIHPCIFLTSSAPPGSLQHPASPLIQQLMCSHTQSLTEVLLCQLMNHNFNGCCWIWGSMGAFEMSSCFVLHTMILHTLLFFHYSKAARALPSVDEINNKLKNVVKSQGHSKNTFIKLNEEIRGIRTQISQVSCCKSFHLFTKYILEKRYFILKFP